MFPRELLGTTRSDFPNSQLVASQKSEVEDLSKSSSRISSSSKVSLAQERHNGFSRSGVKPSDNRYATMRRLSACISRFLDLMSDFVLLLSHLDVTVSAQNHSVPKTVTFLYMFYPNISASRERRRQESTNTTHQRATEPPNDASTLSAAECFGIICEDVVPTAPA